MTCNTKSKSEDGTESWKYKKAYETLDEAIIAAKKQNARMRIACTGTPVENTLTDIWCLFDFVQPGLLGALKDFGERYRKPIEAETEEEKARIEELRAIIEPQKLRRTNLRKSIQNI